MSEPTKGEYLYHFTCPHHIDRILTDGYLRLVPSQLQWPINLRMEVIDGVPTAVADNDSYKPVVWLTRNPNADAHQTGLMVPKRRGEPGDKTAIRITVLKKPEHTPWRLFADTNHADKKYRKAIEAGRNPNEWYVSERAILATEFVTVENMVTGEVLYRAGDTTYKCPVGAGDGNR